MVEDNHSIERGLTGFVLFVVGFFGVLLSGDSTRVWWSGFSLLGFLIFIIALQRISESVTLGKLIPFNRLEQNKVYQVIAKLPEIQAILIDKSEELERGERGRRVVEIPDSLAKYLEKGQRFVKVGDLIAKLPSSY